MKLNLPILALLFLAIFQMTFGLGDFYPDQRWVKDKHGDACMAKPNDNYKKEHRSCKDNLVKFLTSHGHGHVSTDTVAKLFDAGEDKTVLWSSMDHRMGDNDKLNMEAAQKFAATYHKTTVETTEGGKILNDAKLFGKGNDEEAADLWNCASWLFATNAKGVIHAFNAHPSTQSKFCNTPSGVPTFWNIELPTIKETHHHKGKARIVFHLRDDFDIFYKGYRCEYKEKDDALLEKLSYTVDQVLDKFFEAEKNDYKRTPFPEVPEKLPVSKGSCQNVVNL